MKETQAKSLLVKHLISVYPDSILGSEISFYYGERRADLLMMKGLVCTCIEIKTANDSLAKLKHQIDGYRKFFDYCYVACEPDNLNRVKKLLPISTGILLIQNGVKEIRRARRYQRLNKEYLASYLSAQELKKLVRPKKQLSKHELSLRLSRRLSLSEVYQLNRAALIKRYSLPTALLKNELGTVVTSDDLHTLETSTSETSLKLMQLNKA